MNLINQTLKNRLNLEFFEKEDNNNLYNNRSPMSYTTKTFNKIKSERINYGGTITYSEEKEIDRISEAKIHEKNLVNSRFDEKEEKVSRLEGKKEIITTKFLRRKLLIFNDGTFEEGNW